MDKIALTRSMTLSPVYHVIPFPLVELYPEFISLVLNWYYEILFKLKLDKLYPSVSEKICSFNLYQRHSLSLN